MDNIRKYQVAKNTNKKFKKIFSPICILVIFSFIISSGFGCKLQSTEVRQKMQPIVLNFWSVYDDEDAYSDIIKEYKIIHPNISVNYRKFRYEEYEEQLINAFAEDRGPDIFSIPSSWVVRYKSKITPMPEKISMAYVYTKGTLQKETVVELRTNPTITLRQLKEGFPDVVSDNVVFDGKVHGLPLSVDTMVMFYNKDILNNAGIVNPPATWNEFQDVVKKMTKMGSAASTSTQKIVQAGTAMGTGNNIDRAFDILSLLFLQSNAIVQNQASFPIFNITGKQNNPGYDAIVYYTDFASPGKDVYSWNPQMPNALQAFMAGQVGIIFGYNFNLATIKAGSPKLKLGIAPVPQLNPDVPKSFANYWVQTVSKKSKYQNEAWDFVLFMTKRDMAEKYLAITKKPAATRSLISEQLENEDLHAAALQTLTSANWYKGYDPMGAENIFKEMSNNFIEAMDDKGRQNVIRNALERIRQTYINPNPTK